MASVDTYIVVNDGDNLFDGYFNGWRARIAKLNESD